MVDKVRLPVSSLVTSAFPKSQWVGSTTSIRSTTSERGVLTRLQSFVNLQASEFAATQVVPTADTRFGYQGGRGVYVRAERGSLPPRASDMLAVRNRAIDGRGLSPPRSAALLAAPGICTHWKGAAFSRRTPKADLRACACGHLPQIRPIKALQR